MENKLEWGPDEGFMGWDEGLDLVAEKGDGWRLPTVAELVAQFDYNAGKFAVGFRSDCCYWTGHRHSDPYAWFVGESGLVDYQGLQAYCQVRFVRERN
jgi:hypothetical protein